jgi:hypothetical protein
MFGSGSCGHAGTCALVATGANDPQQKLGHARLPTLSDRHKFVLPTIRPSSFSFPSFPRGQQTLDVLVHGLGIVRLWHGALLAELLRILDRAGHRCGQQHVQSRTMLSNPLRQPETIYRAGHIDIGEYNVDDRLLVQEYGNRFVCIGSFNDPIPAVPKVLRNGHADQNFALYKEDCFLKVGLVGHAKQRATPGLRSSAQKHLDVLDQAPGIVRLREKAISVAPMTCGESLAGG